MYRMYLKAIIAIVISAMGAIVVALGTGNTDVGDLDASSWLIAALTVLGSGGLVYLSENGPAAPAIKSIMAFLSAGIGSLVLALDDNHVTQAEWLTAASAAVVATGFVYQATNEPNTP